MASRIDPRDLPGGGQPQREEIDGVAHLWRTLSEWWEPHEDQVEDPRGLAPAIAVIPDGDGWRVHIHPAEGLTAEDRAAIWEDLDRAAREVIGEALPGVNIRVVPPVTFPDGQTVAGIIQYQFRGACTATASRYWWEQIAAECPAISAVCSHHLAARAQQHGGRLTPQHPPHVARQLAARRRAAPRPAPRPVNQSKRGPRF